MKKVTISLGFAQRIKRALRGFVYDARGKVIQHGDLVKELSVVMKGRKTNENRKRS